ncbi:glycerol-3-phosphate dehydrogenase/oxidase [Paenibacillus sp. 2KB_20]|uniref:glycerol-3-phosphate dehydrogenase/oxidase n=1 Tax=Paenibacillus sp. 2KB_20 TaxID=3232977 RepID=UPI003F94AD0E
MYTSLSAKMRTQYLQDMSAKKLDVLVIGGGITGAGIAWDASCRGMSVGLVEMNDFASGTSCRSTKLIHGGLRYLKQGEIGLVREVGSERALLHRSAPHLVEPIPMLLPIYKKGTYGYLASAIGLYLYDWLARVKRSERRKMFRRQSTLTLEPLFRKEGLKGSGYYYEYRTDDARLTVEVMKSARAKGALIANYAKVQEFMYRGGKVVGVHVEDQVSDKTYTICAKKIINAAGPWVDQVRLKDNSLKGKRLLLTKGVHLVVDHAKLPIRQAAYFDVPGGRMIFVIPREGKTYIGTTDTLYEGTIETPGITEEDRRYLIDAVNHAFPESRLKLNDIESGWSGLRPLVREEGKDPSEISRKDEMFISDSGLITIAGGKLTGFRKMAEKVVNLAARQLQDGDGTIYPPCTTDRVPISGGDLNGLTYEEVQKKLIKQGESLGIRPEDIVSLMNRYGSNTMELMNRIGASSQEADTVEHRLLRAEIEYSIEYEMTMTAVDFLLRRTGWILFDRQKTERTLASVMRIMREYLEWNHVEVNRQWELLQDQLQLAWGMVEDSRMERFTDLPDREGVTGPRSDEEAEHSSAVSAMNR